VRSIISGAFTKCFEWKISWLRFWDLCESDEREREREEEGIRPFACSCGEMEVSVFGRSELVQGGDSVRQIGGEGSETMTLEETDVPPLTLRIVTIGHILIVSSKINLRRSNKKKGSLCTNVSFWSDSLLF
jgi:hypothetical protein